jgi:phospholipid/cholesterol/gamma-HCH transport system substrate-binding protein
VNYAVVGGFVLILGSLLVACVLWLASGGALQKRYDLYLATSEESVSGLNVNAPVKYNGVDVGKVRDIRLDPENAERVRLIFAIERGTPVTEGTVAVLKTQGLTGIAYVELSGSDLGLPPLRAAVEGGYPEIPTKPSLIARLENMLSTVLAALDNTSGNLNAIFSEENREAFKSILADAAIVARTIADSRDALDAGIAGASQTFENSARATEQLESVIARIGLSADAVEKMGNEVALASAGAGTVVNDVGADVKRFTSETLPELEHLVVELRALSISLRRLSEQTERNPAGLLFGRVPVPAGPGE